MRIGIDAITPGNSLRPGAGGMRSYVVILTTALAALDRSIEYVVFEGGTTQQADLTELNAVPNVRRVICPGAPGNRNVRIAYQNTVYPFVLRAAGVDVTLGTCNVMPLGAPHPFVVVLQSLQCFSHPDALPGIRGSYLRAAIKGSLRAADAVIAISAFERDEAVRYAGVAEGKVHVVHHGVWPAITAWRGTANPAAAGDAPYILTVTTLYRYKNVERLIDAFALLRQEHDLPHRLRIVGGDAHLTAAGLRAHAEMRGVGGLVDLVGPVPNDQLPAHFAAADLFVYPSLYETFGIPPIEAMTIGCPVVAARSSSIPEIVGEAAELVDPLDARDMARGMASVLLDRARREALVRRGNERVGHFTWERAARQTLDVLLAAADVRSSRRRVGVGQETAQPG